MVDCINPILEEHNDNNTLDNDNLNMVIARNLPVLSRLVPSIIVGTVQYIHNY